MNAIGYQIGRFARFFGFSREKKRLAHLMRETQFLEEAVDLLGRAAWQDTADIDDLAVEFYQIREAEKKQRQLRAQLDALRQTTGDLDEEKVTVESSMSGEIDALKEEKIAAMDEALELMKKADALREEQERLKRRFAGQKLKLKAIDEGSDDVIGADRGAVASGMDEMKAAYGAKSDEIDEVTAKIKMVEERIATNDDAMEVKRAELKAATSKVVNRIGKVSKEVAEISATIGSLQNTKNALANQIGKFLSQNVANPSPEVKPVLRKHRALTSKIAYFQKSIYYQQKLTRR